MLNIVSIGLSKSNVLQIQSWVLAGRWQPFLNQFNLVGAGRYYACLLWLGFWRSGYCLCLNLSGLLCLVHRSEHTQVVEQGAFSRLLAGKCSTGALLGGPILVRPVSYVVSLWPARCSHTYRARSYTLRMGANPLAQRRRRRGSVGR